MIGYGMLYASLVGVPIFLAALAGSAALRRYGQPERGAWLAALTLALVLPLAFMAFPPSTAVMPSAPAGVQPEAGLVGTGLLGLTEVVVVANEANRLGADDLLMALWLLASLFLALRWALAARRLAKDSASWRSREIDGIQVWQTTGLGPAVSGVFRTRILVPDWLLSMPSRQRALVLLHEMEHIRARDPVVLAAARIARIIAPWNPVVWLLSSKLLHALETDCDGRVLRHRPDIAAYGDTLLQVSAREAPPLIAAAAFTESHVPLKKRIVAMTTPPRTASVLGITTASALAVLLIMGSCEVPVPTRQGSGDQESTVESSQIDMVRLQVERDGSVLINGVPHEVEEVSEVVGPLQEASGGRLIASIAGDEATPYRIMDRLQIELSEIGVLRVVFVESEPASSMMAPGPETAIAEGLPMVLPPSAADPANADGPRPARPVTAEPGPGEVRVSARNILQLVVQPDGMIEVRLGESSQVQRMQADGVEGLWLQEVASNPNLIAVVKGHPEAPYRLMTEVLAALQAARAERISLQVLEG